MVTQAALSVREFLDLPGREGPRREYDSGELIEMAPPGMEHGRMLAAVVRALQEALKSDYAAVVGPGFALAEDIFRIPDVFVIARHRATKMPTRSGWQVGAPEIAVEIVSPTDVAVDLDRKIRQYLSAGAQAVWAAYPDARHVVVFRRDGSVRDYSAGSSIEDEEFFQRPIEIRSLFPK